MKKAVSLTMLAVALTFASTSIFADYVVTSYTCEVKEGKKAEDVQAINSKWLKWVHANVSKDIKSSVGSPIVGNQEIFIFVDTYPDLNTWATVQTALDSPAAKELENIFEDVSSCSENKLWKFTDTK
jgi:hypothetical protein